MSIWDDPDVQIVEDYVKFNAPGDTFTGTITNITKQAFDDGKVAPQINAVDTDGVEKILTAGARNLKQLFLEQRPNVGDTITVTFVSETPIGGGKKVRHWTLDVHAPASAAPAAVPSPAGGTAATALDSQQQAAAAAMANLTDDQKRALGLI